MYVNVVKENSLPRVRGNFTVQNQILVKLGETK